MADKTVLIPLTDRAPVRISNAAWPIVASANWADNKMHDRVTKSAGVYVREHADFRRIVYGSYEDYYDDEPDLNVGRIVETQSDAANTDETVRVIHEVAKAIGRPELADVCISRLPAEDL